MKAIYKNETQIASHKGLFTQNLNTNNIYLNLLL